MTPSWFLIFNHLLDLQPSVVNLVFQVLLAYYCVNGGHFTWPSCSYIHHRRGHWLRWDLETLLSESYWGSGLGIFTILFGFTVWILVYERNTSVNKRLLSTLVLMYILATMVRKFTALSEYHPWCNPKIKAFGCWCIAHCKRFHHFSGWPRGSNFIHQRSVEPDISP